MPRHPVPRPAAGSSGGAGLSTYGAKRDFDRTPEPPPGERAAGPPGADRRFVVQRHRARRLHYDFRLEIDGVLVSWAVPKGVTLDPAARHLAVHVEDHPLEYADFEGVIPDGGYGAGDVIVWDRGTWELHGASDPRAAVDAGEIHVELHGEKLRGRVVLVRTGAADAGKENWLVLHKRDDAAVAGWDPEDHPRSVLSGRDNDEVAARPDRVWTAHGASAARGTATFEAPTAGELAALDALPTNGSWELQGRTLALRSLDKVLFPAAGSGAPVTKRELVRYYACIAPVLLPYLADRPLDVRRFPAGIGRKGVWQRHAPSYTPEWIERWTGAAAAAGRADRYLIADSPAALAWLADHAAVELHAWASRAPHVERPDYALVDLEPGAATSWDELLVLARLHRTALEHLGVRGYPKTSGRRGLQIWIPIRPGPSYADTRAWVEQLSRAVAGVAGDLVRGPWERGARGGRARRDPMPNARNPTLVAPYSVCAGAGAPVSAPIAWDELDDPGLRPDRWDIRTLAARLADVGDLMAPMRTDEQRLPPFE